MDFGEIFKMLCNDTQKNRLNVWAVLVAISTNRKGINMKFSRSIYNVTRNSWLSVWGDCDDIAPMSACSVSNVMCMHFILSPSMSVLLPCRMLWTVIVLFCELKKTQPVFRVIRSLMRKSITDRTRIHQWSGSPCWLSNLRTQAIWG